MPTVQSRLSPRIDDFHNTLKHVYTHYSKEEDAEREREYTPLVSQYYTDTVYRKSETSGSAILKKIDDSMKFLFPRGRFKFQITLHEQMLRASLRQILGSNYNNEVEKVCRERGWDGPMKNMFVIASRRSGKTTGLASMIAAMLMHVPNIQVVVFSVGERSAQEFVRLIERYLRRLPGGEARIKSAKAEQIVVRGTGPDDERRVKSFPSGGNAVNVSTYLIIHPYMRYLPRQGNHHLPH